MSIDAVGRVHGAASAAHHRQAVVPQQPPAVRTDIAALDAGGRSGGRAHAHRISQLQQAIDDLNVGIELAQRRLHFRLHKETERLIVFVVDSETDEVIRQVPPEEVLDAAAKLKELIGLLLDERV